MKLYRIHNVYCPLDHDERYLRERAAKELGVRPGHLAAFGIERRSIDARDKRAVRFVYTLTAGLESPSRSLGAKAAELAPAEPYRFPAPSVEPSGKEGHRPIIVGAGPAGLFCALMLAEAGYRPIVIERGDAVDKRGLAVSSFWNGGELDPESNMQFGEGGAGTYSDGKLTTSSGDGSGRAAQVLDELVAAGAPESIRFDGKPHIGTDTLVEVVKGLRRKIESLGGEIRFRTRVEALAIEAGRARGVVLADGGRIDAGAVVLAIGHSSRDTFASLAAQGVPMERKPFAIGLRIEHPQEMISRSQYGDAWDHPALGAADYKLTHRASDGRSVYTFCMCPGGYVVDASSEPGLSACNGMSDYARDAPNANAAIVVSVRPDDFEGSGPLAGVEYQRRWERLAWEAAREASGAPSAGHRGRSALPVQALGDFMAGRASACLGGVTPSVRGSYALAELSACLPPFVASGIREAVPAFDRRLSGFGRTDAALCGVETRTSSPVRVTRDDSLQSSLRGLFPCGEGAGYAGGIMSAAVDGVRVAEAISLSSAALLG